jgi:hypothetical protein
MHKSFVDVEEMIADDMFLSWFYRENDEKIAAWEKWLKENPGYEPLALEAVNLMKELNMPEAPVSSFRVEAAYSKWTTKLEEFDNDMAPVRIMKPSRKRWWMGAAAAALILFAGLTYSKFSSSKPIIETPYGQVTWQGIARRVASDAQCEHDSHT